MGKQGKFLHEVLHPTDWEMLQATYATAEFENIWQSLSVMGNLFRKVAKDVANTLNFTYPEEDDQKVTAFIRLIRTLPEDADSFDILSADWDRKA